MKRLFGLMALVGFAAPAFGETPSNQLTEIEKLSGWKLLFDGETTEGWRNYHEDDVSDGWVVEDGMLVCKGGGAGDLITRENYGAFELMIDWKISPGGNSGLMFHVTEEGAKPWHTGPEIQIQDNAGGHDGQKAGWLYQLYQPPIAGGARPLPGEEGRPMDATRPAGQWNTFHIRITPEQSEVNVNGYRYYQFQKGSEEWKEKVANSKFAKLESFGEPDSGYVCLQDHGNEVAFRNIKIRPLPESGQFPAPVHGKLSLQPVVAFPHLNWSTWSPIDDRGRVQELRPIVITHANDGSGRIFTASQRGTIHVFDNETGATETNVFLDLEDVVAPWKQANEEGFLGLAFHPNYRENGHFFVYYTRDADPSVSVISRFTVSPEDPNKAMRESEKILMEVVQPFWNHNGGTILFGNDGYLYIALGDGGAANDPYNNAQNLAVPLGKVLRIDVDGTSEGKPYGIPEDNPFVDREGAMPEIFAYGFRNPWRLSLDEATGDLWMGDVGQNLFEEINVVVKGGNYGWNLREGMHDFGARNVEPADPLIEPVWEYDHQTGKSITGGEVYRGPSLPELQGKYIYADYVSGELWALDYDRESGEVRSNKTIPSPELPVLTFGEDADGEVYFTVASPDGRGIYKLQQQKATLSRSE